MARYPVPMNWTTVETDWGPFRARWEQGQLAALTFPHVVPPGTGPGGGQPPPLDTSLARQLNDYFSGHRQRFALPLHLAGTEFQLRVWRELLHLSFGRMVTYSELARRVGCPQGARAVGGAVGANPVPIVVPCHRVVGAGGRMGGFGAGLEWKRRLLAVEGAGPPPCSSFAEQKGGLAPAGTSGPLATRWRCSTR